MMKAKYSRLLLVILLLTGTLTVIAQQRDSRNRLASTVIADGLTQLPAQNNAKYDQVIGEMAATGAEGIESLIGMLNPSDQGKNATFEYAINGIVNYVTAADKASLRQAIHDGLVNGLVKTTDKNNQAFLISQLQKLATAADADLLKGYMNDSYLANYASRALIQTPGTDQVVTEMIKNAAGPKDVLAYMAYAKGLSNADVESTLMSWVGGADTKTQRAIYNALTVCGTSKALPVLAAAAKAAGYSDDQTGANDAYLQLLGSLVQSEPKTVSKIAKQLVKQAVPAERCAGLDLLLQTAGEKAPATILKALKSDDRQYRNTALGLAEQVAGKQIFNTIASKLPSLPTASKVDVVRWLGNNHATSFADVVAKQVTSSDNTLAEAAIYTLGQLGGNTALETLLGQLGGSHAANAADALLAFNGNINEGVAKALANSDVNTQVEALKLASARRMNNVYPQVLKALSSDNTAVKAAAFDALKGVARVENFDEICDLMEKADASTLPVLQEAAKNTLQALSKQEQFNLISSRLQRTKAEALYFPLLAQAGNDKAINKLVEAYKKPATEDVAYAALLDVNNTEVTEILYDIASKNATRRDGALKRYLQLVNNSSLNDIDKYLRFSKALELNPSTEVTNIAIDHLSDIISLPSLALVSKYMDTPKSSVEAAGAVKYLVSKQPALNGGDEVKGYLEKAKAVFAAQTDADSGYAVDEIKGMLQQTAPTGFTTLVDNAAVENRVALPGKYENFELYFEYQTTGTAEVNLRSMAILGLDSKKGSKVYAQDYESQPLNGWNSIYVKVVNDRLQLVENGVKVLDNAVIKNNLEGRAINNEGIISWWKGEGETCLRNVMVNELPSTPVYVLSDEEKKAGFEVLFDGLSREKWHGNTINYVPQDGTIYVSAGYGNNGNLYTNQKYSDFVYRFEFCFLEPGVNNGIGIRTKDGVDAAYDGMEIHVLDHDDPIYKGLRPYQQHGSVYGIIVPKHVNFEGVGVWNTEEIRAVGDHITVTVNGEVITDGNIREACQGHNVAPDGSKNNPYTVDHLNHPGLFNKDGYISFCGHGEGVKFRNIRILDLSKKKTKKK
ncbi:MAG: DUF1080 domain-containing protein [Prevotella sp.]|nr:DUF1080 domain-containing protein [Prevotella sp.]